MRAVGREEGVPVLPFHDTLEDPDRPGRMREEWTAEGDHPSVEGYRRLGKLAFRLPFDLVALSRKVVLALFETSFAA